MATILERLYPEIRLTGSARHDHRMVFFNQVNQLLKPEHVVLDFGAGRGKWATQESPEKLKQTSLKGKCAKVIGVDVDPAVAENPLVDETRVIEIGKPLPFPDQSFDLIMSWAVLEHVDDAKAAAQEIDRLLKPGGYLCAWTPNKWSYFAIAARLIPNRYHAKVLRSVGTDKREDKDVFPTRYRMNTLGALRRLFSPDRFEHFSFIHNGPTSYFGGSMLVARLWQLWMWLLPSFFGQCLHIFLRKK